MAVREGKTYFCPFFCSLPFSFSPLPLPRFFFLDLSMERTGSLFHRAWMRVAARTMRTISCSRSSSLFLAKISRRPGSGRTLPPARRTALQLLQLERLLFVDDVQLLAPSWGERQGAGGHPQAQSSRLHPLVRRLAASCRCCRPAMAANAKLVCIPGPDGKGR